MSTGAVQRFSWPGQKYDLGTAPHHLGSEKKKHGEEHRPGAVGRQGGENFSRSISASTFRRRPRIDSPFHAKGRRYFIIAKQLHPHAIFSSWVSCRREKSFDELLMLCGTTATMSIKQVEVRWSHLGAAADAWLALSPPKTP
jgi:hypothetical protein